MAEEKEGAVGELVAGGGAIGEAEAAGLGGEGGEDRQEEGGSLEHRLHKEQIGGNKTFVYRNVLWNC